MAINFKAKSAPVPASEYPSMRSGSNTYSGQRVSMSTGDKIKTGTESLGILGGLFSARAKNKQEKRIRQQLQQNINISKQQQQMTNTLGKIDISNQMGLSLASRLSGALQMTGSNAETYAQEGRNMSYNLAVQSYQYDIEQTNLQNQINESKARSKMNIFNGIIDGAVGAGKVIASVYTGGATAGA